MKRLALIIGLAMVLAACGAPGSTATTEPLEQPGAYWWNLCADEGHFYQALSEIADIVTENGMFNVRFARAAEEDPQLFQTGFAFYRIKPEYADFLENPTARVGVTSPTTYSEAYNTDRTKYEADTPQDSMCAAIGDVVDRFGINGEDLTGGEHMGVDTFLDRALPLLAEEENRAENCYSLWYRAHLMRLSSGDYVTLVYKEGQHASGGQCGGLSGAHETSSRLNRSFYGVLSELGVKLVRG